MNKSVRDRLFEKVRHVGTCWEWTGGKHSKVIGRNYGVIHAWGKPRKTHRVSWIIHNGPIPDDKEVCHKCDNPPCINPEHLLLGSHHDNMRDMADKNRAPKQYGELNAFAALSNKQAQQLVDRYHAETISFRELGRLFGVTSTTAHKIVRGEVYPDLIRPQDDYIKNAKPTLKRTHCPKGHRYEFRDSGRKVCRECARIYAAHQRACKANTE